MSSNNSNQVEYTKCIESSENEVLKSRVDEQARLITFYKNRGDEFNRKIISLEKLNHDLVEQKAFKFLRIESKHAQKESEIIDDSMRRIVETENEMMKHRLDEQSNLIIYYKNRGEENMEKILKLEYFIKNEQEKIERLNLQHEELKLELSNKRTELENKIIGLVEICNQNEKDMIVLKAECEAKLEGLKNENSAKISYLNNENEKCIKRLNLDFDNQLEILRNQKDNEIKGLIYLYLFIWVYSTWFLNQNKTIFQSMMID